MYQLLLPLLQEENIHIPSGMEWQNQKLMQKNCRGKCLFPLLLWNVKIPLILIYSFLNVVLLVKLTIYFKRFVIVSLYTYMKYKQVF